MTKNTSGEGLDPKAYQSATNAAVDAINELNLAPHQDLPLDPVLTAAIRTYNASIASDTAGPSDCAGLVDVLEQARFWLEGALNCKAWSWDADQHEAASYSLARIRETIAALSRATEAEPAAWRWQLRPNGAWLYGEAKPSRRLVFCREPLYTSGSDS